MYHGSDSLIPKLAVPVVPGGETNGIALFIFPTAPSGLLDRPATFYLQFADVFGTRYSLPVNTTGQPGAPIVDLPGVTPLAPVPISPTLIPPKASDGNKPQAP